MMFTILIIIGLVGDVLLVSYVVLGDETGAVSCTIVSNVYISMEIMEITFFTLQCRTI